ncbi:transmembrane protein 243 [Fukomys damarensis]|uniref:transmembrane protein 243 n=1 Tax=Fukomys damarensis TaxID=885580 RepID=UPI0014557C49|nr:transmembrane protein 243 [Fukomys damarensis]
MDEAGCPPPWRRGSACDFSTGDPAIDHMRVTREPGRSCPRPAGTVDPELGRGHGPVPRSRLWPDPLGTLPGWNFADPNRSPSLHACVGVAFLSCVHRLRLQHEPRASDRQTGITAQGTSDKKLWHSSLDRIINLVVGGFTCLLILVTLISAFVFPHLPPKPLNVFFAVCISLSSATACILIYWYRQGDLEPKFRSLIYYILFSIIMLCICANLYFHNVGR